MNYFIFSAKTVALSILYPFLFMLLLPIFHKVIPPLLPKVEGNDLAYLMVIGIPHNVSLFISAFICALLIKKFYNSNTVIISLIIALPLSLFSMPYSMEPVLIEAAQYQRIIHTKDWLLMIFLPLIAERMFSLLTKANIGRKTQNSQH
ncbi:hypothetical protein [Litorilituus lipolyticus]|uniref:Uncharacterized protein n=1 Tax=Litorilituus lipolyticus TaxID=2491017 RepID=A0A502KTN8_9GAMM|nr:hypothetical protein [Litorilituus lipolyticus]TPH13441.1 hypothetical protein EPA86_14730 [Litorilituus lipolyticus]